MNGTTKRTVLMTAALVADPGFLLWVGAEMPERRDDVAAAQAALADR